MTARVRAESEDLRDTCSDTTMRTTSAILTIPEPSAASEGGGSGGVPR